MTHSSILENYGLHRYALQGDDEGVRRALKDGADVNALDSEGRNAIMCTVSGEHWRDLDACDASFKSPERLNALKLLLNHPRTSLVSMNLPHSSMSGVIPLGMASWLDYHQAVRVLLEETMDSVSVDGMDSQGATALMYAARDGNLEVVKILLSHGARADFRDRHYRTSIQFGLKHPQVLWLCETTLRRHRLRESKSAERTRLYRLDSENELLTLLSSSSLFCEDLSSPPLSIFTKEAIARSTNVLIQCILTSDISFMYSLLFSPPLAPSSSPTLYPLSVPLLINVPDANGWSLIHYCASVENPSIDILDALYCAGAEISLFTINEEYTVLHILARSAMADSLSHDSSQSLRDFAFHLIEHLRAPLAAQDKTDETCIHQAAEHGQSLELLKVFLAFDSNGTIREMKNSRGLTALQVAKPEFLSAFGVEAERSPSALSQYTVRPSHSVTSLSVSGPSSPVVAKQGLSSESTAVFSPAGLNVSQASSQLLQNLQLTSPSISHSRRHEDICLIEQRVDEAQDLSNSIVIYFRSQIEDASRNIDELYKSIDKVDSLRNMVSISARSTLAARGLSPILSKRRQRDSEDSQKTCVHIEETDSLTSTSKTLSLHTDHGDYISRGIQTSPATNGFETGWIQRFARSPVSSANQSKITELINVEEELAQLQKESFNASENLRKVPSKTTLRLKQVMKKKKKIEEKFLELEAEHMKMGNMKVSSLSGASKVKTWLKRIVGPAEGLPAMKPSVVVDIDEEHCAVGHEVKGRVPTPSSPPEPRDILDLSIDNALRTSQVVFENAERELQNLKDSLATAEEFIQKAQSSISKVQRMVQRGIKQRDLMVLHLFAAKASDDEESHEPTSPSFVNQTNALSSRPSITSIATIYSTTSSISSADVTTPLTSDVTPEDDDIKTIRRLLSRKIEAQLSGAWDEVDKVVASLQIVKEAVRSVKRRAYL